MGKWVKRHPGRRPASRPPEAGALRQERVRQTVIRALYRALEAAEALAEPDETVRLVKRAIRSAGGSVY